MDFGCGTPLVFVEITDDSKTVHTFRNQRALGFVHHLSSKIQPWANHMMFTFKILKAL